MKFAPRIKTGHDCKRRKGIPEDALPQIALSAGWAEEAHSTSNHSHGNGRAPESLTHAVAHEELDRSSRRSNALRQLPDLARSALEPASKETRPRKESAL